MTKPKQTRRVGSYQFAIEWLARNDDNEWINDTECVSPSVTFHCIMDTFDRTQEEGLKDLKKAINEYHTLFRLGLK